MDGTTNEHADLQIQGFPHLVLFPAGPDAQPVPYDGDRSLKVQVLPPPAVLLPRCSMTHWVALTMLCESGGIHDWQLQLSLVI